MKMVNFSDTHSKHSGIDIPDGDILVITGDVIGHDDHAYWQLKDFSDFVSFLPHKYKLFVPGNHDSTFSLYPESARAMLSYCKVLINEGCTIEGINFWGTPIQPFFNDWYFNEKSEEKRYEYFKMIPEDCNVLLTHCPPFGILDKGFKGEHAGDKMLLKRIKELKNLKYVVFGHLHNSYGTQEIDGIKFVNCSLLNEKYQLVNKPVVIEI
jgi:Icc-related predicted phosphoesterase